jgi:serine/threonine protein kinase
VRPAPDRFGPYDQLEVIRHGGMGIVYKARDTRLNRIVALKTMRADRLGPSPEMVERFRREAQAIAHLSHLHIIPIHDFGEQDGQHYFAMAFAVGGSLGQHLERYHADVRAAAGLLEKIARAVQYAHDKGILHRDLKPANVLLDEHGEPLVSDFGLAKFVHADSELTQTGAVMGTPSYMAPEQAGGQSDQVGPATDIWALGVMLYELLTGQRPFVGSNGEEIRRQVREADPPRARTVRPGLDRSLETIVLKCLDKEPARRYSSAGALADDLGRWLRGEPILARPEGWRGKLRRTIRRHPNLATAVLVAVVVAAVTAAAIKLTDRTGPPKETLSDLDRVALEIHDQLERGEDGTLIGGTGPPRGSRWVLGGGGAPDAPSADRPFGVSAYELALLEVLPATLPQQDTFTLPERYIFRAEVKPTVFESNATSSAWQGLGFYFGYTRHATKLGIEHCFCQLVLSYPEAANWKVRHDRLLAASTLGLMDAPPGPGLERAVSGLIATRTTTIELSLDLRRYREQGPGPTGSSKHRSNTGVVSRSYVAGDTGGQTWHPLAVKVTPETVEAFWGKESIGTWRQDDPWLDPKRVLKENPELDPKAEFGPHGGLGLCVEQGGAQFRRVVIQPIK